MNKENILKSCQLIKTLSTRMDQKELIEKIQECNFPLGFHLAIMGNLSFVTKYGRLPTKKEQQALKF